MTDETIETVPDLVPARILNEFVYCPRLFYLKWVDGNWDENAGTAQGTLAHRRSDTSRGRPPRDDRPATLGNRAPNPQSDAPSTAAQHS